MFLQFNSKSLSDGRKFEKMKQQISNIGNLSLIEKGSEPLPGFQEGLENMGAGRKALKKISDDELAKLSNLENKFNTTLNQYKSAFKSYLTKLATDENAPTSSYKSKVIKDSDGNFYWVNNLGYARKFSVDAWNNRSATCPAVSDTVNQQDFTTFPQGPEMGSGERCGDAGINVQSSSGGGTAFIAANGMKHPYQDFRNKNADCPAGSLTISDEEFSAIPTGKAWTSSDSCNVFGNVSGSDYDKVQELNNSLESIATEMNEQVKIIAARDDRVDKNRLLQKTQLINKATELEKERKRINDLAVSIVTSEATFNNKKKEVTSVKMHYIVWALAAVTLGGIAIKQISKS